MRKNGAKGNPKLHNRPITHVLHYINFSAVLPTKTMFALCWKLLCTRIEHVWHDAAWVAYFQKEYMVQWMVGQTRCKGAQWYYGAESSLVWGHPPSPQPVEQSHATLKRAFQTCGKSKSMVRVMEEFHSVGKLWCTENAQDEERSFSLKCGA